MGTNLYKKFLKGISLSFLFFFPFISFSTTYYTRGAGGNWSDVNTWSDLSCNGAAAASVPGAGDDVFICASNGAGAVLVITDGAFTCNNLTVGDGVADATVQTTPGNSLNVNGALQINSGNNANVYTLDAGFGTINVNGTFSWGTNGTNRVLLSTGTVTFAPLVNLSNANQYVIFSGAGTINFNAGFTCNQSQAKFITFAGCTVNFGGSYIQSGPKNKWNAASLAVFNCVGCY